jgi:hypothetical protein
MHAKNPFIDSRRQAVSSGPWHTTWFLMVEELCPLKYEALKYGQEYLDLRSRSYNKAPYLSSISYKLALKSSKGEQVVANKKLLVGSRSSKEGTWKGINTH